MKATFAAVAALLTAFSPLVNAHGQVRSVSADGVTNDGPNIYYDGDSKNSKTAVRKMFKSSGQAFALPKDFRNPSVMSCENAGPAPKTLSVKAGSSVKINWEGATGELLGVDGLTAYNPWVHAMGPINDYLASCEGECNKFDATNADWVKIAAATIDKGQTIGGQLRQKMVAKPEKYFPTGGSGLWAMAKMVQDSSSWTVNIPSALKAGQYILRSEMSAVHNPKNSDPSSGPQVYIACIQLDVTGSGNTPLPQGVKSSSIMDPNGAFANYNVYGDNLFNFQNPGPAVWNGASSGGAPAGGDDQPKTTTSKAATTSKPTTTKTTVTSTKPAETTSKAAETTSKAAETTSKAAETTSKAAATTSSTKTSSSSASATSSSAAASATSTRRCKRRVKRSILERAAEPAPVVLPPTVRAAHHRRLAHSH
jgi:hypothetical protein